MVTAMPEDTVSDPDSPPIICRVTRWYYRRQIQMSVLLLVFGGVFFYDGYWGYPADNAKAALKKQMESFEANQKADPEGAKKWLADASSHGWVKDANTPPDWPQFSKEKGWALDPERHSPGAISQQFQFAGALALGSLVCAILMFLNRTKTLRGFEDRMVTPDGQTVYFDHVVQVDKRKWNGKGLAYVYYREKTVGDKDAEAGPEKRAIIDDLKYGGAGKILVRLLRHFSGEVIDKEPEAKDAEAEAGANPPGKTNS